MTLAEALVLAFAYLLGALPTAYLAGRRHSVHLAHCGDGNLGTRNTFSVLGLKPALCVGAVDIGKGALATWLASVLTDHPHLPYAAALLAAVGHDFSIYIGFTGGKGMAVVLGSLLVLHPIEALLGLALVGLAILLLHKWDLAWSLGMASMLAWSWYLGRPRWQLLWLVLLFVSIGLKKLVDLPRERALRTASRPASGDGPELSLNRPPDPNAHLEPPPPRPKREQEGTLNNKS
jgi:glycerol-3-phosphate acyltransferase PlsY